MKLSKWTLLTCTFYLMVLYALLSSFQSALQISLVAPIEYRLRQLVGLTPPIDPRIKLIGLDDRSLGEIGSPALNTNQWQLVLSHLAKAKPRAILIDALLALNSEPRPPLSDPRDTDTSEPISTPIFSGAILSSKPISGRSPIDLHKPLYQWSKYGSPLAAAPNRRHHKVYGHHVQYSRFIKGVGDLSMKPTGEFAPFFSLAPNALLPHMSLLAAAKIEVKDQELYTDGHPIPLTPEGLVEVDFRPQSLFYPKVKSLASTLRRAAKGLPPKYISEGDIVLIIPGYYTGNVDFFDSSPFGSTIGGFVIASAIDGFISGNVIKRYQALFWPMVLMAFGALIVGAYLRTKSHYSFALEALFPIGILGFALAAFCLANRSLPWLPALTAYIGIRVILEVARVFHTNLEHQKLLGMAEIIQTISHDIRRPYDVWHLALTKLHTTPDQELRSLVQSLAKEIQISKSHVEGIVSDFLEYGSTSHPSTEPTAIAVLIQNTLKENFDRLGPCSHQLDLDPTLYGEVNPHKINRALANMLDNAREVMTAEDHLIIKAQANTQKTFVIEICNTTDSPLDDKVRARLFEPFYTSGKQKGTGLGLYIASKIASAHGGSLICHVHKLALSRPCEEAACRDTSTSTSSATIKPATSFLMTLPLTVSAAHAPSPEASSLKSETTKPELALIEDNLFMLDALRATFNAKYVVHCFESPDQFWQKVHAASAFLDRIDLVITDFHFDKEGVTGAEFAQDLRPKFEGKIVLLTSLPEVADAKLFDLIVTKGSAHLLQKVIDLQQS